MKKRGRAVAAVLGLTVLAAVAFSYEAISTRLSRSGDDDAGLVTQPAANHYTPEADWIMTRGNVLGVAEREQTSAPAPAREGADETPDEAPPPSTGASTYQEGRSLVSAEELIAAMRGEATATDEERKDGIERERRDLERGGSTESQIERP